MSKMSMMHTEAKKASNVFCEYLKEHVIKIINFEKKLYH